MRAGTKQAQIIAMLQRPEGATVAEIVVATGWLAHYADARIMPIYVCKSLFPAGTAVSGSA
ncbi:MAG: DUF3489 domain-containing protein [Thermaurantiacus sp.]